MNAVRYLSAASIGLLVTTAILYLMQLLIDSGPAVVQAATVHHVIDWVRLPPQEHLIRDEPRPPRPQPPAQLPPDPRPSPSGSGAGPVTPPVVAPEPAARWSGISGLLTDGPLVAVIVVSPEYPLRAAAQGLEGHVTVQYDVTEAGTVANVVILESSHRVFEAAAAEAAYRFRYKPQIVDGVAQPTRGLRNRFVFRMQE